MIKRHKISIIIPTYNRADMLDYTLNSIKKQNLDLNNLEVVVVHS